MKIFYTILTVAALTYGTVQSVHAEASFEGTQNGITRTGLNLFGGYLSDIVVDSSGRAYAAFNAPNGAFCLASNASEWTDPPAGTDMGSLVAVALGSSAGTAFVIGSAGLFRTSDGCTTWTELTASAQADNYGFSIAYGHNTLLVETRNGGIDRSADNGGTFTNATFSGAQSVDSIAVSPTSGEFFALVNQGNGNVGLFRSTDSGASWTNTGKSGNYADVAVDPADAQRIALSTNSGGVELSTNGGSLWNPLNPPPSAKTELIFINGRLYKGSVYTDNTTTWSSLPESSTGADMVGPVAAHPSDSSIIYAGTELGLAKSADSGANFTDLNDGIHAISVQDIAQESGKNILYLATESGLAKTTNFLNQSGPTWTFPVTINPTRAYQGVYSIHIDRADSTKLYAGLLGGEMYYSTNAGSSWTAAAIDPVSGADIPDIAQTDDGTLYATFRSRENNSGGVLRSTDSGVTWTNISIGSVSIDCNSIAVIGNTIFVGAGDDSDQSNLNAGIYSYDGSSWTKLSGAVDGQIVKDLAPIGTTLIAVSAADSDQSGGVFLSPDSGASWKEVTSKGLKAAGGWYHSIAVDPVNTDIIYVAHGRPGGRAEIYYSQDKGATWALMFEGLTDEVPAAMLVDDLTVGSGVGFSGVTVASSAKLTAKVEDNVLTCTLRAGNRKLRGQKISLELKKGAVFLRKKTKATSAKGAVSFPLKSIKKKSTVRCRFLTKTSGTKKLK